MTERQWIRDALDRFEGPLLLYARRLTGDAERARDVVQDTFLKLCRQRRADVSARLAEWLYTVCRNAAIDVRRKERVMRVVPSEEVKGGVAAEASPAAQVAYKEQQERLLDLLDRMPAKQQEVLRLKFQGGLSYKEISRVTGESISNVGVLLHVGLRGLRARVQAQETEGQVTS
ncbi:MAG: sigma-70 family RNA polymerase sigma factor [Planctomycetota bacterium]